MSWIRYKDAFYFAKFVYRAGAKFAMSVPALFHTTEGQMNFGSRCGGIEVYKARLDITHSAEGEAIALCIDSSGQAIFCAVRHLHRLFIGVHRKNRDKRPKHLFTCNAH